MNTMIKQTSEIELHCLERRFEHVRINNPSRLNQLTTLNLRMSALKRLGQDTIQAEKWECDVAHALLASMAHQQN